MWRKCEEELPDSDLTVLIYDPTSNEPVWFGYHDGEMWLTAEGMPTKATHWMPLPDPPEAASEKSEKSDLSDQQDPEETMP